MSNLRGNERGRVLEPCGSGDGVPCRPQVALDRANRAGESHFSWLTSGSPGLLRAAGTLARAKRESPFPGREYYTLRAWLWAIHQWGRPERGEMHFWRQELSTCRGRVGGRRTISRRLSPAPHHFCSNVTRGVLSHTPNTEQNRHRLPMDSKSDQAAEFGVQYTSGGQSPALVTKRNGTF